MRAFSAVFSLLCSIESREKFFLSPDLEINLTSHSSCWRAKYTKQIAEFTRRAGAFSLIAEFTRRRPFSQALFR
jgi:hypothetical protein